MKTIGLLGGMSWESSAEYYRVMNETVMERLGGLHSAKIIMYSVDFQALRDRMLAGEWDAVGDILAGHARTLEAAGAELIVIGTNTMHLVAPQVEAAVSVPLLHIADATADAALELGVTKVGLLGTVFTMEKDFYAQRLVGQGLEVLVPEKDDRRFIDAVIFDELCKGVFTEAARRGFRRIMESLVRQGAQAVILGCTEIGLLVRAVDCPVFMLDTCRIHAAGAVDAAL